MFDKIVVSLCGRETGLQWFTVFLDRSLLYFVYHVSSNTARVSNLTWVNLPIQISKFNWLKVSISPLSQTWTQVIMDHEIN